MNASAAPTKEDLTPILAGTQCTLCGYPSCAAYAEALTQSETNPTLCAPGGPRVAQGLATALKLSNNELRKPNYEPTLAQIAVIFEPDCIGCTLCLQKCPTSAIVGAPKQIHTILPDLCTGCNLCTPVCPTNCITLQPAPPKHALTQQMPDGSLTKPASEKIWSLVKATEARKVTTASRTTTAALNPLTLNPLTPISPEIAAKIAAARTKSAEKFAAKGPIRTPRALKTRN